MSRRSTRRSSRCGTRCEKSDRVPIFEQFHDWLEAEAPKVLPKSPIGEAIPVCA